MANTEQQLERYLRQQLTQIRSTALEKLVLRHSAPGAKGPEVETFKLPETIDIEAIPAFAMDIMGRAQEDADGLGGVQRYVLFFHEVGSPTRPCGRYTFRLRGEEDAEWDESSGEEAPTTKGMLTQLMRHNEALTRIVASFATSSSSTSARRQEQLENTLLEMHKQRQTDLRTLEAALTQQHERDILLLTTTATEERKDKMFEKLSLLLPAVLQKLTGHKIIPGDDPHILMIKELVNSFTPTQLGQLTQTLSPEQQIVMVQLIKSVKGEPKKLTAVSGGAESK